MKADIIHPAPARKRLVRGLHARMALSYVWVTTLLVLFLEIVVSLAFFFAISTFVLPQTFALEATQVAQHYALAATILTEQGTLNPHSTFQTNQPASLVLPGKQSNSAVNVPSIDIREANTTAVRFVLLIAPDGHILASTYPRRYTPTMVASALLPERVEDIAGALSGESISGSASDETGPIAYALETVWSQSKQPIGAIYVQLPATLQSTSGTAFWQPGLTLLIMSLLALLLVTVPLSLLFGFFTTRHIVHRLRDLGVALTSIARGDYGRRVAVTRDDEIGYLEQQFNLMTQQLATSITNEKRLSEQNVRLAERTRISRDLHDSVKQYIFAVSMQIGAALSHLENRPEKTRQHLQNADELVYEAQQELTKMISELRPVVQVPLQEQATLKESGSADTLYAYAINWSCQNQLPVNISISAEVVFAPALQMELLRVAQEALSNIMRHSYATQVSFALTGEQGQVVLTIRDNGCGFDSSSSMHAGVGLHSMRERMEELGGSCEVVSQVKQGTCVTARVPSQASVRQSAPETQEREKKR